MNTKMNTKMIAAMNDGGGDIAVELISLKWGSRTYATYMTRRGRVFASFCIDGLCPVDVRRPMYGSPIYLVTIDKLGTKPKLVELSQTVRGVYYHA